MQITKAQFIAALTQYGDNEGCGFDEYDRNGRWNDLKINGTKSQVWNRIKDYFTPSLNETIEIN